MKVCSMALVHSSRHATSCRLDLLIGTYNRKKGGEQEYALDGVL